MPIYNEVKGLGDQPVLIRAVMDDDSILEVAVAQLRPELAPERFHVDKLEEDL